MMVWSCTEDAHKEIKLPWGGPQLGEERESGQKPPGRRWC